MLKLKPNKFNSFILYLGDNIQQAAPSVWVESISGDNLMNKAAYSSIVFIILLSPVDNLEKI